VSVTEEPVGVPTAAGVLDGIVRRPTNASSLPGVVLVDGSGPGSKDGWGGWPEWVADCGAVVLRHDKPGCGDSPGEWRGQTFEDRADESLAAARVLASLPDVGPVGLLGISQGGWVSLLAASRDPDAVDFVVTISGPGVTPAVQERVRIDRELRTNGFDVDARREALAWVDERASRLVAGEPVEAIVADQAEYADRPWYETTVHSAYDDPGVLAFAARILEFDPLPAAAALRCPALVLFGGADHVVPVAESVAALARVLPGLGEGPSGLAVFPDGNHGLFLADPDPQIPRRDQLAPGFLPMLEGFLAAVATRDGSG
jgi:uncharacterized protein